MQSDTNCEAVTTRVSECAYLTAAFSMRRGRPPKSCRMPGLFVAIRTKRLSGVMKLTRPTASDPHETEFT